MERRDVVRAVVYDIKEGDPIYLLLETRKGYWQNPQGGMNQGESEIEAILRETCEESGLNGLEVYSGTRVCVEYDMERGGTPFHVVLVSYAVRASFSQNVVLSPEDGHTSHKWVMYEEALSLLTQYPEQILVFEQVVEKLHRLLLD